MHQHRVEHSFTPMTNTNKHANGGLFSPRVVFDEPRIDVHSTATHVMCRHTPIGLPQFEVESLEEGECHIVM